MTELAFTAASFRQHLRQGRLMGSRCDACGRAFLPPRPYCPDCQSGSMTWAQMGANGTLVAFTSVFVGPTFMNEKGFSRQKPYLAGIVELEGGQRISARIEGLDPEEVAQVEIGAPLELCLDAWLDAQESDPQLTFKA